MAIPIGLRLGLLVAQVVCVYSRTRPCCVGGVVLVRRCRPSDRNRTSVLGTWSVPLLLSGALRLRFCRGLRFCRLRILRVEPVVVVQSVVDCSRYYLCWVGLRLCVLCSRCFMWVQSVPVVVLQFDWCLMVVGGHLGCVLLRSDDPSGLVPRPFEVGWLLVLL